MSATYTLRVPRALFDSDYASDGTYAWATDTHADVQPDVLKIIEINKQYVVLENEA